MYEGAKFGTLSLPELKLKSTATSTFTKELKGRQIQVTDEKAFTAFGQALLNQESLQLGMVSKALPINAQRVFLANFHGRHAYNTQLDSSYQGN